MSSFYNGPMLKPCVLDIGSSTVKVGYAGEDVPLIYRDSTVYVGENGGESQDLSVPRTNGEYSSVDVTDTSADALWSRTVASSLTRLYGAGDTTNHPVLLVDANDSTVKSRASVVEAIFETHGVPSAYLGNPAVLSCFAVGKTTGTVVDVAGSKTTVSCVSDGWCNRDDTRESVVGGDLMDDHFLGVMESMEKLKGSGKGGVKCTYEVRDAGLKNKVLPEYHEIARRTLGRYARGTIGGVSLSSNDQSQATLIKQSYTLPDGTDVEMGEERFQSSELLFGAVNKDREAVMDDKRSHHALQHIICDAVFTTQRDQQAGLLATLVLAGGGMPCEGAADRLKYEVENIVHTHTPGWRVKVLTPSAQERKVQAWLGGSILASLVSFQENWMSKKEYDEHGERLVEQKCP
jgi:actin-like protein 6A